MNNNNYFMKSIIYITRRMSTPSASRRPARDAGGYGEFGVDGISWWWPNGVAQRGLAAGTGVVSLSAALDFGEEPREPRVFPHRVVVGQQRLEKRHHQAGLGEP